MAVRGPVGFRGSVPRRFRERGKPEVTVTVSFTPPVQVAIGNLTALGKPRGFLGFPARRFRERVLPVTTTTRIMQAGLEPWVINTPELRVYQIGLETWIGLPGKISFEGRSRIGPGGILRSRPRRIIERPDVGFTAPVAATSLQIFQAGLEVWTKGENNIVVPLSTPVGPKGFLHRPQFNFRERQSVEIGFTIPPASTTEIDIHQIGLEAWGNISTSSTGLNIHQVGLEPWAANTPELRIYQAGAEPWVANTPVLRVYQIGIEVWIVSVSSRRRRHVQVMFV